MKKGIVIVIVALLCVGSASAVKQFIEHRHTTIVEGGITPVNATLTENYIPVAGANNTLDDSYLYQDSNYLYWNYTAEQQEFRRKLWTAADEAECVDTIYSSNLAARYWCLSETGHIYTDYAFETYDKNPGSGLYDKTMELTYQLGYLKVPLYSDNANDDALSLRGQRNQAVDVFTVYTDTGSGSVTKEAYVNATGALYSNQNPVCTAANGLCNQSFSPGGSGNVTGSGVANYYASWTNSTDLDAGFLYDDGAFVYSDLDLGTDGASNLGHPALPWPYGYISQLRGSNIEITTYLDITSDQILIGDVGTSTCTGAYCIALGYNADATGDQGISIGKQSTADDNSIAIGHWATSDNSGIAIGYDAYTANVLGSTAIGPGAKIYNQRGMALGYQAKVYGDYSFAQGYLSRVDSASSFASGSNSRVGSAGGNSFALGSSAEVNGTGSGCIGYNCEVVGNYGYAVGYGAYAGATDFAFGYYARADANSDAMAIGRAAVAPGATTIAIGREANSTATGSVSIGYKAKGDTGANYGIAIGREAVSGDLYQIAIGFQADDDGTNADDGIMIGRYAMVGDTDTVAIGRGANATATEAMAFGLNYQNSEASTVGFKNTVKTDGYFRPGECAGSYTAGDICFNTTAGKHYGYNGTSLNAMY